MDRRLQKVFHTRRCRVLWLKSGDGVLAGKSPTAAPPVQLGSKQPAAACVASGGELVSAVADWDAGRDSHVMCAAVRDSRSAGAILGVLELSRREHGPFQPCEETSLAHFATAVVASKLIE